MSTSSSAIALQCNEAQSIESTEAVGASEISVSVRNLGKSYRLWNNPQDRLKQPLRSMFSRWLPIPHKQYFNEFWALRDINFDVKKAETLGIIGRNGSGKSTLLQILCGTLAPTCGSYETRGRVSALLELGSGFNPQFSGRDNVYMNASILGLTKEEIDERYESIVEFADIGQFIDQPVNTYSSGMYVRLAFAVAISVDPDLLVIDEALAVGDTFFVQKCMRWMRAFQERGTLIFVSHDTNSVKNLCNKTILLEHGMIKAQGSSKEVCDLYLESIYAERQAIHGTPQNSVENNLDASTRECELVDQRLKFINMSKYRNDIELFSFSEESACFGTCKTHILDTTFYDATTDMPLSWVVGGERVVLSVKVQADIDLYSPILGFQVRDRLGQCVFGDNTFVTYRNSPIYILGGSKFEGRFTFRMPILAVGDYSVSVAIVEGNQEEHVVQHWVHDALFFKSQTSSVCFGLLQIPMEKITIEY